MLNDDEENLGKQIARKHLAVHNHQIFYDLIKEFYNLTGVPVLINTSFNVRGEPIVNTPEDAWNCFINTKMDYLAIGSFLLDKRAMKLFYSDENWKDQFELD